MVRTRPPLDVMRTKYRYNAPAVPGPDERSCNGFDVLTRYTIPVRRSGGCLGTMWYQPRCVMVRTRPDRRHADATLNEWSPNVPAVAGVNKIIHTSSCTRIRSLLSIRCASYDL